MIFCFCSCLIYLFVFLYFSFFGFLSLLSSLSIISLSSVSNSESESVLYLRFVLWNLPLFEFCCCNCCRSCCWCCCCCWCLYFLFSSFKDLFLLNNFWYSIFVALNILLYWEIWLSFFPNVNFKQNVFFFSPLINSIYSFFESKR